MSTPNTWQPAANPPGPSGSGHPGYTAADAATSNPGPTDTPATEDLAIMNEVPGNSYGATHTGA